MNANMIEALNKIEAQNDSASAFIAQAIDRAKEKEMSERAQRLIINCAIAINNADFEVSPSIAKRNVYAIEKVTKAIKALQSESIAALDKYTVAIVQNMLKRTKNKNISNKEQNASLCVAIECDTLSATATRLHKASSTADTQSSSTRHALEALNIAIYDRNAKELRFADTEIAKRFAELFKSKK